MANIEGKVLFDTFQKVRDLTKWYFSLLKTADPYKKWEVNGLSMNNLIWIGSHLCWAENFLMLKGTGGKALEIDWLDHYSIKSDGSIHHPEHDMKTILDTLKMVHDRTAEHVVTITDEQMEQPNILGFGFGGLTTNRILIQHAIRHEAMHTGHLSWLCRFNNIQTV